MKVNQLIPFIDQLIVSGSNFLVIAISAHILQLNEQGKIGVIFLLYVAMVMVNAVTIYQYANIEAPRNKGVRRSQYHAFLILISIVLALLMSVLCIIFLPGLTELMSWEINSNELMYLIIFLVSQQFVDFIRRSSYIFHNDKQAVYVSALTYIPRILFLFAFNFNSAREVLEIMLLSNLVGLIAFINIFFKKLDRMNDGARLFINIHFKASRWFIVSGPLSWLWAYVPVFFLGKIDGLAAVAVLTSVRSITNVGNTVMEILDTSIAAKAGRFQVFGKGKMVGYIRNMAVIGCVLWLVGFLTIYMASEQILRISIGQKYIEYADLLAYLWCVVGFTFLFRLNSIKLRTMGFVKVVSIGYGVSTAAVLVFSPKLIFLYGIYGAAIAFLIGAFANLVTQIICIRVLLHQRTN